MDIFNVLSLLGGLSLFLFGMSIMGQALERRAGGKLRRYLAKPFGMMEMVSRIRAVLRRSAPNAARVLRRGELELDDGGHQVKVAGENVELTLKEYELLRLFLKNPGQVFSRDQLLAAIWDSDFLGETRTVDVHIASLRMKLGVCGETIRTVRGIGYRMEEER